MPHILRSSSSGHIRRHVDNGHILRGDDHGDIIITFVGDFVAIETIQIEPYTHVWTIPAGSYTATFSGHDYYGEDMWRAFYPVTPSGTAMFVRTKWPLLNGGYNPYYEVELGASHPGFSAHSWWRSLTKIGDYEWFDTYSTSNFGVSALSVSQA